MANSFNISRSDITRHKAPFDFIFEWDNGTERTFIVVSLHGAKALAETFENFGYEEEEGSVSFKKGACPLPTDSCNRSEFKLI